MSDLISRSKIRDYIKTQINPYGKPFEGTSYELGLKIMRYIDAIDSDYGLDKVVEELEELRDRYDDGIKNFAIRGIIEKAIEIVKQGGVADDVCEWHRVANVSAYKCNTHAEIHDSRVLDWCKCPYCGKKIKVVE